MKAALGLLLTLAPILCAAPLPAWAQQGAVTETAAPLPPPLPGEEAAATPQGEIVCRPPQRMTETRNLGPRVCRPKAVWDDLHAKGLDISADGRGYVQSEKYRTIQTCGRGTC